MKFKFIRNVEGETVSYGNEVGTGDVVDLPPHFAAKAKKRPNDYQEVLESDSVKVIEVADKPRVRKTRVKVGDEG